MDESTARLLAAGNSASGGRSGPAASAPRPLRFPSGRVTPLIADALHREAASVPSTLSWDLFLGVAPAVDYHPIYHPHHWRGWVDWGQGALGDMGAHLIDHPFKALDLGLPTVIETLSTPFNGVSFPHATTTYYQFPARGDMPAVKLTWYDGGLTPPRPEELGDEKLNGEGGIIYVGSKGKMMQLTYGHEPRLLPKSLHDRVGEPKPLLPRVAYAQDEHEMNWIEAIQGKAPISSPFEYAARLTEVMLLGIVSLRAGQKTPGDSKIHYDGASMRVTNTIRGSGGTVTDPNERPSHLHHPEALTFVDERHRLGELRAGRRHVGHDAHQPAGDIVAGRPVDVRHVPVAQADVDEHVAFERVLGLVHHHERRARGRGQQRRVILEAHHRLRAAQTATAPHRAARTGPSPRHGP